MLTEGNRERLIQAAIEGIWDHYYQDPRLIATSQPRNTLIRPTPSSALELHFYSLTARLWGGQMSRMHRTVRNPPIWHSDLQLILVPQVGLYALNERQ